MYPEQVICQAWIAQWLEHPPTVLEVPGSIPGVGHTKDFKNGSNGFPPWCSGIKRVSITTDSSVSVLDDWPGTSPWCAS